METKSRMVDRIVKKLTHKFSCQCTWLDPQSSPGTPLGKVLKKRIEAKFTGGVDVAEVVKVVLEEAGVKV